MNRKINKTFYACSSESMFLRYIKISKKASKIGSFLQCSVHIFLGNDGCFWKLDLRILWNHIMKNFQIKHSQCDNIIFRKTFFFWKLWAIVRPLPYWHHDSLLWQVVEFIHKFIIDLLVLQCLFVRGSNKEQRRGRAISDLTKGETFSSLMTT